MDGTTTGRISSSVISGMPHDVHERVRQQQLAEEDERRLVYYCRTAARLAVLQLFERASLNAQLVSARPPGAQ